MKQSGYRMYSIGIVLKSKIDDSDFILVTPIEELYLQPDGSILGFKDEVFGSKQNLKGEDFNIKLQSTNFIEARWRSLGNGNRQSAPNVGANETVIIYKYANVDEYFWDELGREPLLRTLENVVYGYSNEPSNKKEYDEDSSYWLQISTRDKLVKFHISDNDGEATTWDFELNTAEGTLKIDDGEGNYIHWDGPAGTLEENFNTSITRKAPLIHDISEHRIEDTTTYDTNSETYTENTTDYTMNTTTLNTNSDSYTENSTTYTHNSSDYSVTASTITTTGNISDVGPVTMSATLIVTGIVTTAAQVVAMDVTVSAIASLNAHIHTGIPVSGVSGPAAG